MKYGAIFALSCLMGSGILFAERETPEAVKKMGLSEVKVEGATIYYEPSLADKLDVLKKAYGDYRQRMAEHEGMMPLHTSELVSKKAAVVDSISKLIGADDETKDVLVKVAESFDESGSTISLPLTGTDNVIYLVLQETTKDYLRAGGTLPNLTYDKTTDSATYRFYFGSDQDNASNRELLLPVKSADEVETTAAQIFSILPEQFKNVPKKMDFIVVHEMAEAGIIERMNSNDPYKRWFTDGFANAVAYEAIKDQYSQKDADEFIGQYDTAPYQDIKNTIDLECWMSAQFTFVNKWPVEKEQKHIYARYCFATEEARRIVNEHGIESVKKILDTYVDNGVKKPGAVIAAIQQATGDDINAHLMEYHSYGAKKEGLAQYQKAVEAAMADDDYESALFSMLRILDLLGEQPLSKESLQMRQSIAMTLIRAGHPEEATKSITEFADWMCDSKDPQNLYVARQLVILHALQIGKPQAALDYAQQVLEDKPEDVNALTIMMLMARAKNDIEKAVEIAEQICTIQPDEDQPSHHIAKQILAENENKE